LINYAEVVSSTGPEGLDLDPLDVDSTPNDDQGDDTGGQVEDMPDCSTEPEVINDDNNVEDAGVVGEDEDDHDPAWVHVFDLATIIYTDQTLPVIPGDEVKFVVEVYNQGNMSAEEIDLLVHIPEGFTLSPNDDNEWEEEGGNVVFTHEDVIIPEDSSSVCLILEVLPDETLGEMIPIVEITGAMDTLGNDRTDDDLDSDPNVDEGDDEGGEIFTDSDDELDGNGEAGDDEDDHDPAVPPVLDLAIRIVPENEEPVMPGDTAKFIITLKNQGSIVPSEFTIEEYIPEGLEFCADPVNAGWTQQGPSNAVYTYTEDLLPLTEDTLCIYLKVTDEANPQNVVTMVEYIEVIDMEDRNVSLLDIDSEADNSNENDLGNDLYSPENDKCEENGRSGEDEDDHDQAWVNMCGPIACKGAINFSIDESCEGSLTAAMLLTGDIFPEHIYEITVKDENGNVVPNHFSIGDVNKTYEVTVTNKLCDNISCWLLVTVEYKFGPVIECALNDTLSCLQAFDEASRPDVSSNCVPSELVLLDEKIENLSCDPEFTSKMVRVWTAIDLFGNVSDTCTQEIYLERTNLDNISSVFPYAIYNDRALECGSGYATTSAGYPYPALSVTGAPRLEVSPGEYVNLFPFESTICNGYAEYEDEILPGSSSCVTKILRTFTIGEWWCGGTNEREFVQLIEVVDFTGPELSCPSDITVSTADYSCESSVSISLPMAEDICNDSSIKIDLGTPSGFYADYAGEEIGLPVGIHTLTYTVYDDCGNNSQCDFTVTVQDNADPIAVCDQLTEVSIGIEATTYIAATAIDDGSFDECGPVTLSVARMLEDGSFDTFAEEAPVYCSDAGGEVMIGMLVTDMGGNTNMCMVSVFVKDKVDAKMIAPADVTVSCDFAYDEDSLDDFFGSAEILDNCPEENRVESDLVGELTICNTGSLVREMRLYNSQGEEVDFQTQTIVFESATPLLYSDITPPSSEITIEGCGYDDIGSIDLPMIPSEACRLTSIAIENDTFPFVNVAEGACLKILRKISVIDWCAVSGSPGSAQSPFEFEQIVKVNNVEGPEISNVFASDSIYESFAIDCGGREVAGLSADSEDECTPTEELLNRYVVVDGTGEEVRSGTGLDASGFYDVGEYVVFFTSEDRCGNQSTETSSFTVLNAKQPTAYCYDGLSTSLTLMDPENDGEFEAMAMLHVSYFDAGSSHPCEGVGIAGVSFSADLTDTLRTFDCSSMSTPQIVEVWVTDENGNTSYCEAELTVTDPEGLCGTEAMKIEGSIYTESEAMLGSANVVLQSVENVTTTTDAEGYYSFGSMPLGGSYSVVPEKDDDVLNGVSTLDLVMIQRHILGLQMIESPYKLLAADINKDDKLTASDLLALRKVILGIDLKFKNNTSWRFIDEAYDFVDSTDPWDGQIPENYTIPTLEEDMWIDFVGVKVGDINGNVSTNIDAGVVSEIRSARTMNLSVPDVELASGEVYEIAVQSTEAVNMQGMQLDWITSGIEILEVVPGEMNIGSRDMVIGEEGMKLSYASTGGEAIEKEATMFTLLIEAKTSGMLSEMLEIAEEGMASESYTGTSLDVEELAIEWRRSEITSIGKFTVQRISPNPWKNKTEVHFELPASGEVRMVIRDGSGKLISKRTAYLGSGSQTLVITEDIF